MFRRLGYLQGWIDEFDVDYLDGIRAVGRIDRDLVTGLLAEERFPDGRIRRDCMAIFRNGMPVLALTAAEADFLRLFPVFALESDDRTSLCCMRTFIHNLNSLVYK